MDHAGLAPQQSEDGLYLISAARAGDENAWRLLVEQASPVLRGVIRSRATPTDTDEILQNAWMRIFASLDKYDPARGPWIAFCRWHAINAAIDFHRRGLRRRHEVLAGDLAANSQAVDANKNDPLDWLASVAARENAAGMELVDETTSPKQRDAIYCHFLRLTFSLPSPPHELICFGFIQLLEWKPRRVVSELGPSLMKSVESRLESDFERDSGLSSEKLGECFAPLREHLLLRLRELLRDMRTRKRYDSLLDKVVAETLLHEYFSSDPGGDIAAWWWGVHRRLVRAAADQRTPEIDAILEELM